MEPSRKNDNPAVPRASAEADPFDLGRTLRLSGVLNWEAAEALVTNLETLATASNDPIRLVIASPGGLVACGLAVLDTINRIAIPVTTEVMGCAYSAGALVAQAGTRRLIAPNGLIRLHEVTEDCNGMVVLSQMQRMVEENVARQGRLESIIAKKTGQPRRVIHSWCINEHPFGAEEALKMRLVDAIIGPVSRLENPLTQPK
ncbi:MAG: ATP-dependent Clp protease proteolytic subunit [Patescibacteria group bacterium]